MRPVVLTLYVCGETNHSQLAITNLRSMCEEQLSEYKIKTVDVLDHPELAEQWQVMATPAVVKELPPPIRRVIGDLSDRERVLVGLAIDREGRFSAIDREGLVTQLHESKDLDVRSAAFVFSGEPPDRREEREDAKRETPAVAQTPETSKGKEIEREGVEEMTQTANAVVDKLPTGIPGFDQIAMGGVPKGRTTLVAGTAGSAKTVFASQFLAEGLQQFDEPGVFVTFEETPDDIRQNLNAFGWPVEEWERDGKWTFVDASPQPEDAHSEAGDYDLGALIARVEYAVRKVGAKRVSLDSLGAVFARFEDAPTVRGELFRLGVELKRMNVTTIMTAEREDDYGRISRFGVEEFVADNVVVLRNVLEGEKRRRTVEILKFRGCTHQKGEWPFTILENQGIVGVPLSSIRLDQVSSDHRISCGVETLDELCGGGFFRDSVTLVSGATGTGKTLLGTHFVAGGLSEQPADRSMLFAFEESREQLFRNAHGWGIEFGEMEEAGKLVVDCNYPEVSGLEDHLIRIKSLIDRFQPRRVAIDSLSALQRIATPKTFREFVIGLSCYLKEREIAALFTAATPDLMGGSSLTEAHVSTMTDSIILLRYVEIYGEMRRGITVLKMRGSFHVKDIREFTIDHEGMHIGKRFRNVSGILKGEPTQVSPDVVERVGTLFRVDDESVNEGDGQHASPR